MPKIISKCCELVQLCHINRSGPGFFETQCRLTSCVALTVMPASSSICLKASHLRLPSATRWRLPARCRRSTGASWLFWSLRLINTHLLIGRTCRQHNISQALPSSWLLKTLKKTFWSPLSADFPKIPIPKQDNVHRMPAICLDPVPQILNPLERRGNYSATSTNMKLVHWPLMGGLLHLVQRWGDCAGPQPVEAPPRCTKCNSAPNNYQCTNHVTV